MNLQIIIAILPFLPIVLAPAVYLIGRKNKGYRNIAADVVCGAELVLALYACARVFAGEQPCFTIPMVCLQGLSFEMDGFRAICVLLACWLWFVTTVFSAEYLQRYRNRNRYYLFVLMSFGGAIGLLICDFPLKIICKNLQVSGIIFSHQVSVQIHLPFLIEALLLLIICFHQCCQASMFLGRFLDGDIDLGDLLCCLLPRRLPLPGVMIRFFKFCMKICCLSLVIKTQAISDIIPFWLQILPLLPADIAGNFLSKSPGRWMPR